jgi:D-alanyl-D-alanine carboxypeptidase
MSKKKRQLKIGRFILFLIFFTGIVYGAVQAGYRVYSVVSNLNWNTNGPHNSPNISITNREFSENENDYTYVTMLPEDISKGSLILVNNEYLYPLVDQTECVSLFDYKSLNYNVKDTLVTVSKTIIDPLNRMLDDFYKSTGLKTVNVVSGFRTYEFQESLYLDEVKQKGEAEAKRWVARPGGSEHHTGLAVDFSLFFNNGTSATYDGKGDYRKINDNAHKYGFVMRYDRQKENLTGIAHEPWHFRYVGIPHSYIMVEKDFCLEEYIDYLRGFEYGKNYLIVTYEDREYEIYFTTETRVPVPKDLPYDISGNNVDGFIVTVYR